LSFGANDHKEPDMQIRRMTVLALCVLGVVTAERPAAPGRPWRRGRRVQPDA
jgi:hypothetical protein